MRILLTGDKGYIGAVMVPMLVQAGHSVVGLDATGLSTRRSAPPRSRFPARKKTFATWNRPTWKGWTRLCTWLDCPTIRWAI